MKRRRGARTFGALALVVAAASCSFNLDRSLLDAIAPSPNGGGPGADGGDGDPGDGSSTQDGPIGPAGPLVARCTNDGDCKANHGCLNGRCDTGRGACVYDVCKQPGPACSVGTCDVPKGTCGAPAGPVAFKAATFDVGEAIACADGLVSNCIAAAYPFVFVLTKTGVRAWSAITPSSPTPRTVSLSALPFVPFQIIATATRVYAIGPFDGTKASVAWLDVPVDPFVSALTFQTPVDVTVPYDAGTAYPSAPDGIFVVTPLAPFKTARVASSGLSSPVASYDLPALGDYSFPVAASGSRLFVKSGFGGDFRFVLDAGAPSATLSAIASIVPAESLFAASYAQGPDGSIAMETAPFVSNPTFGYGSPRLHWLVADSNAAIDFNPKVTVENYGGGVASGFPIGPLAWLDRDRVLVIALAAITPLDVVSVQVATKATNPPSMIAGRRFTLPLTPQKVGASGSNGIGYVLTSEATPKVHVVAADCN